MFALLTWPLNFTSIPHQLSFKDEIDASLYIDFNLENTRTSATYELLGEERQLVLFFLDVRDFTPFVKAYLPFDVIHVVRRLFDIFSPINSIFMFLPKYSDEN